MRNKIYIFLVILFSLSCNNQLLENKNNGLINNENVKIIDNKNNSNPIYVVDECSSDSFIFTLEENMKLDSNSYILKIFTKDSNLITSKILNTRPRMSRINYCSDKYAIVGFSCGGPCYAQAFVFTDKNKDIEHFSYVQTVYGNLNIIVYFNDEEFKNYIIHNFENGKELKTKINDINPYLWGQIDSLYTNGNNLIFEYLSINNQTKKKIVNLEKILK